MERFFPQEKVILTGNPVRKDITELAGKRSLGLAHFGLAEDKPVLMILGGSLGARTLNDSVIENLTQLIEAEVQVIWQCGRFYFEEMTEKLAKTEHNGLVHLYEFLKEMDLAYASADVVISRAGALSVSELSIAGKPTIFVPSPNVAEDHQSKNAKAMVDNDAAVLVKDNEARDQLINRAIELIRDEAQKDRLSKNIKAMAKPNAAEEIVEEIVKLIA